MKGRFIRIAVALLAAIVFAFGAVGCGDLKTNGGVVPGNDPGGEQNGGDTDGTQDGGGGETKVTYTVTFDLDGGGGALAPQTVGEGAKAAKPSADPVRYGSDFAGWSVTPLALAAFDFDAPITADTTVYAYWANKGGDLIDVSFDANGGAGAPSAQRYRAGNSMIFYGAVPQKDGKVFLGWAASPAAGFSGVLFTANFLTDTTLYAVWGDAGNAADSFRSAAVTSAPLMTGIYVESFVDDDTSIVMAADYKNGAAAAFYQKIPSAMPVNPQPDANDSGESAGVASEPGEGGAEPGGEFWTQAWLTSDGCEYVHTTLDGELTTKTKRVHPVPRAKFSLDDTVKGQLLTMMLAVQNPERTDGGYTAEVEQDISDLTTITVRYDFTVTDGKITLIDGTVVDVRSTGEDDRVMVYDGARITITYDGSNAVHPIPDIEWDRTFGATLAYPNGDRGTVYADPDTDTLSISNLQSVADSGAHKYQNGYTAEIYADSALTDIVAADLPLTDDITLYIKFIEGEPTQPTSYTVTFNLDAGEYNDNFEPQAVPGGKAPAEPKVAPERYGSDFIGWSTNPLTFVSYDFDKPVNADTVIYAFYAPQDGGELVDVRFHFNDGTDEMRRILYRANLSAEIVCDVIPRYSGKVFMGWATDDTNDFSKLMVFNHFTDDYSSGLDLYACWGDPDDDTDQFRSLCVRSSQRVTGMHAADSGMVGSISFSGAMPIEYYMRITVDGVSTEQWRVGNYEYTLMTGGDTTTAIKTYNPRIEDLTALFEAKEIFYGPTHNPESVQKTGNVYTVTDEYGSTHEFTEENGLIAQSVSYYDEEYVCIYTYDGVSAINYPPPLLEWTTLFTAVLFYPDGAVSRFIADGNGLLPFDDIQAEADGAAQIGYRAVIYTDFDCTTEFNGADSLTPDINLYVKYAIEEHEDTMI
ncbi:MAG: InlB B-repeat-containing protein [Clostridiales bacterium]|jgi:hypothetical protein|nr:InlB B-repeat-containing protein [Clostridiales bacterium]